MPLFSLIGDYQMKRALTFLPLLSSAPLEKFLQPHLISFLQTLTHSGVAEALELRQVFMI